MPQPARSRHRLVRLLLILTVIIGSATGCSTDPGDRAAARELKKVVGSLAREQQQHWQHGITDPVWLALWAANDSRSMSHDGTSEGEFAVRVEPLSWKRVDGEGVLEVKITVKTAGHSAVGIGDPSYGAGSATRCLRMTVSEDTEQISCQGRTVPPLPAEPYVAPLGESQYDLIKSAMRLDTIDRATARIRGDFPDREYAVVTDIVDGHWVVVVLRRSPYQCAAGVRFHPDQPGSPDVRVIVPTPVRIQIDGRCDPYTVLHPPKTH